MSTRPITHGVPLRPDYAAARSRPSDHLFRAATALFLARARKAYIDDVLAEFDDGGKIAGTLIERAAAGPATTSDATWAASLAGAAVSDLVIGLAAQSAGAALLGRGLRVGLAGRGSVRVPLRLINADDAGGFVAEAAPIPVRKLDLTAGPMLTPHKLGVITVMTNELAHGSVRDVETIIKQMLGEAATLALDRALFSSDAATDWSPPGLLHNVTPLDPSAGGWGAMALSYDVQNLLDALAANGAGRDAVFIGSAGAVAALKSWAGPRWDYPVLASSTVAPKTLIAVDASSIVSGFDPVPHFSVSGETLLHLEDSDPQPIGVEGSPAVVAAPATSLFQVDASAIKMILRCSWAMRTSGHIAVVENGTW